MIAPLKVACVGAGYFSAFHRDAWNRIAGVELVASCDSDEKQTSQALVPAFTDLDEMLQQVSPDIVDIATPPSSHLSIIEKLVHSGVKTIICQKPFCASIVQAKQAVELAHRAGVCLMVHENFRFQPWFRAMKGLIEEGRLGEVYNFTFRLRTGDGQGPGAYMERQPYFQKMPRFLVHETAIHYVDTFRYLFGEPVSLYADLRQLNPAIAGEDAGHFILEFANGVRALFDGNRHLDHQSQSTRLTFGEALLEGTKGSATLSGDGGVRFRAFGSATVTEILSPTDWPGFAGDCVHALQSHIVDCILNDKQPENLATDYLDNLQLEEALYQSAEQGIRVAL